MKKQISKFILKGCKKSKQAREEYIKGSPDCNLRSCALGAYLIGKLGVEKAYEESELLHTPRTITNIEDIEIKRADLPACMKPNDYPSEVTTLGTIVVDLNDKYKWTREAIAKWLKSIGH